MSRNKIIEGLKQAIRYAKGDKTGVRETVYRAPLSFESQCGPDFKVEAAIFPATGWVVTDRRTQKQIATGGNMTLHDACQRLETDYWNDVWKTFGWDKPN